MHFIILIHKHATRLPHERADVSYDTQHDDAKSGQTRIRSEILAEFRLC